MPYCMYLRKSRADAEAELRGEGETLARHEKLLTDFAKQAGLEVKVIYKEIVSGETIAARPQMQKLLSEVSEGLWDGVLVMDIDRLARGNSIDQGIISQTFLYANTKIITPVKTYDPTNEFDEEYFEFGLFMSRREYKTINRRLQRGRIASAKEGKYVGNKAPYGYERVKIKDDTGFTLSPVPVQAEVVRNIFEWYTSGIILDDGTKKRIGTSLIARELNHRKIKPVNGDVWTSQTIRDMLINPVYIGKIRWNWRPAKKKMINGKVVVQRPRNKNEDTILCNGIHEGIISEDVFNKAAQLFGNNKSCTIRGDKTTQNPLAGLVICKKCGKKMQRRNNPQNPDMLICPAPTCNNHASYLYLVEKYVIDIVKRWSEGHILQYTSNQFPIQSDYDYKSELSAISLSEDKLNSQLNKAYEAFETGIYDAETFKKRSTALNNQLKEIQKKKKSLKDNIKKIIENEKVISEFIPKAKEIAGSYYSVTDNYRKNEMLKEIVDHMDYIKETRGHGHEEDFVITVYPKLPDVYN